MALSTVASPLTQRNATLNDFLHVPELAVANVTPADVKILGNGTSTGPR